MARGKALDRDDRMRAEIIEAILCYLEADLEEIAGRHGHPVACLGPDLARVVDTVGSIRVQIDGWKVRLIRDSHEIARLAASCFDGYLHAGARYSAAV